MDQSGTTVDATTQDIADLSATAIAAAVSAHEAAADPHPTYLTAGDNADTLGSGAATDGQVLTATGAGGAAWEDPTGGGGTPGGTAGQVQYNDGSSFAGDSGLSYNADTGSLTVGGKTVTADAPVINLSQTWDNAAATFTGLKLNVTNTASASDSNLLDLQVGGVSQTFIESNGTGNFGVFIGNRVRIGYNTSPQALLGGARIGLFATGSGRLWLGGYGNTYLGYNGTVGTNGTAFGFSATAQGTLDVLLYRDSADTLAQRNSTNAQTYRLYNTYTDASNYERTSITRDSSGLVIDAQKDGTGAADPTNLLDVKLDGVSKLKFDKFGINYGVASAITTYIGLGGAYGATSGFRLYGDTTTLRFASNHTVGWTANAQESFTTLDTALARDSAGVVKVTNGSTGTGYIKQVPVAVSALPAAATVGAGTRGFVNDANATTFASVVAGGGANVVPVYSDGTDWRIG